MRFYKTIFTIFLFLVFLVILMSNKILTKAEKQEKPCSLTVKSDVNIQEDLKKTDVVYDLYKIADLTKTSDNNSQLLVNNENYSDLKSYIENMKDFTDKRYEKLKSELTKTIFYTGKNIQPDFASNPFDQTLSNLDEGMYLLIIHGKDIPAEEYLKKKEGNDSYYTDVWSNYYQYSFATSLITLPNAEKISKDEIDISKEALNYDVTVIPKAEIDTRKGNITIIKEIDSYLEGQPETFIFEVTATYENQVIYNDVVGMTFTHAGKKEALLEKEIPVGAAVNVKEIYSGSYQNTSQQEQTMTVVPDAEQKMLKFHFKNCYEDSFKVNGTITNSYECKKDNDGSTHWDVHQKYDGKK